MNIRLQFVCGSDIASRLIAWYGNGYGGYSHVDAVLPDGSLLGARSDRVGGQPPGVRIRPANYDKWVRRVVLGLSVSSTDAFTWEAWLRSQVGKPYDMPAIWGFLLGRKTEEKGQWICSALQAGALEAVGAMHRLLVPPSQVTPDALCNIVCALGARVLP